MRTSKRWDRVFSTTSWGLVFLLVFMAVSMWWAPPGDGGPIVTLLGLVGAQVFYFCLYLIEASLLAFAKLFKRDKMRKTVLMVIYLTGFFTSIMTFMLAGWAPRLLDNLVVSFVAAFCWLYWTFKTEYVDIGEVHDEIL